MEATFEADGKPRQTIARPNPERLETIPMKLSTITIPRTQGIRMNPIANVTDPQNINASDSPSNSDASPIGDRCGRGRLVSRGSDTALDARAGSGSGGGISGLAMRGDRRTERRREQSS